MILAEAKGLTLAYGVHKALEEASFHVLSGQYLGILGPNGGGKTTLLRALGGLHPPSAGDLVWTTPRPRLGYVAQRLNASDPLFPATVAEVVALGAHPPRPGGIPVGDILASLGLGAIARKRVGELSGGQLQRTLLARALAGNPQVLLLDEPASALDPEVREGFYSLLKDLHKNGMTILLVSHDVGAVEAHCSHLLVVDRKILFQGSLEEFTLSPTHEIFSGRHHHGV